MNNGTKNYELGAIKDADKKASFMARFCAKNEMLWVSFHSHSTYSYGDGHGPVKTHVGRVADLGMKALALSEHGNVNSHPALERECRRRNIKPIFGLEAYFSPVGIDKTTRKTHLTIFAMNDIGYRNLNRIVTQSYLDFYQYPTVSWESLVKYNEGIAVLSGCADSLISCTLLGGKFLGEKRKTYTEEQYNDTRRELQKFLDVFQDRFYLEVQRFPGLERTCTLNPAFARLSKELGIPLIATADVHYPFPHENHLQKTLHAARRGSTNAVAEAEWEYGILLTYPTSDYEIYKDLRGTGLTANEAKSAIANSAILADRCTVDLPKARPLHFPIPDNFTNSVHYLKAQILNGLRKRMQFRPDIEPRVNDYKLRIQHELKIIIEKDFCDYFLIVQDIVERAKREDIDVGPGRGSAAGSLICYLLGITEIDPLFPAFSKMAFERFIDHTRSDPPDIDLDFADDKRNRIFEIAKEVYGNENVASVGNHIKYRGKKALQDVTRAYGLPFKIFDPIGQRCSIRVETDDRVDDSILDVIESYASDPQISALYSRYHAALDDAIELEGDQHSMGIHAGGFVFSKDPIPEICPIYTREKGSGRKREMAQVIPYEKRDAEYLNMLKMDFLGLTTMGVFGLIRKEIGMPLHKLNYLFYNSDSKTRTDILRRFRNDDLAGIFQYEGGTTRQVVRQVQPTNFDELAACNALSRPGPYYGGQKDEYVKVKNGEKTWDRIGPGFDEHVEFTFGQIVYQEQIMWILRDMAGFSIEKVLHVRKIIGKKLGEFQFEAIKQEFIDGCVEKGKSSSDAERVFSAIRTAAGYAFNIAHAYSYALIAWECMYFKINHQAPFFMGTLAKNGDGKDDLARRTLLLQDAVAHDTPIAHMDPRVMQVTWSIDQRSLSLLPGFKQIPDVGEATAQDIVSWREDFAKELAEAWEFFELDWADLKEVKGVGETTVYKMQSFATAEDPFGVNRVSEQLRMFRSQCVAGEFLPFGVPSYEEFAQSNNLPGNSQGVAFVGLAANIVYRDEIETIRQKTGQSIEEIRNSIPDPDKTKKSTIFAYDEFGEVALRASRFTFESLAGRIAAIQPDHSIVVGYGRTYEAGSRSIQLKQLWVLDPD